MSFDTSKAELVHQSGHTNTYCDGERHVRTEGGYVWPDIEGAARLKVIAEALQHHGDYACDCAWWAEFNAQLRA